MPEGIKLSNQLYPATAAQILSQAEYIHDSNWDNELWSNNTEIGPLNGNRKDQQSINVKLLDKIDTSIQNLRDDLNEIIDEQLTPLLNLVDGISNDVQDLEDAIDYYERPETVVINSDGANIIDYLSESILTAPSSRMMKEIYLNLKALFDSENGLADIAFLNGKPNWRTVDVQKHTITLYLTEVVAEFNNESVSGSSVNNESVSGSFDASEGEVTIKLTPATGKMILANNISIMLGNSSVPFNLSPDNNDSVLVTFTLAGNVTFTASASSGRSINFNSSTGCSINAVGVPTNQDLDAIIRANEHFTLPLSITVLIDNTGITHIYTRAQDNKTATLHIDAADITGDLTIVCTAVEDDFAVLDLTGVVDNVAIMRDSESLLGQSTPHVYAGETISILPVGNNKVSATVTIGGNTVTLDGDTYDGFSYTLQSNDVSNGGTSIVIVATVTEITTYNVTLPTDNNFIAELQDVNGNPIESPVNEGSTIKIAITPSTFYVVEVNSITAEIDGSTQQLNEGINYSINETNSSKLITIFNVTGNITILATAENQNYGFKNVRLHNAGNATYTAVYPASQNASLDTNYCVSPMIDLGEGRTENVTVKTNADSPSGWAFLWKLNSNFIPIDTNVSNKSMNGVLVPPSIRYIMFSFKASNISNTYIKVNNVTKWQGTNIDDYKTVSSEFWPLWLPKPNAQGDINNAILCKLSSYDYSSESGNNNTAVEGANAYPEGENKYAIMQSLGLYNKIPYGITQDINIQNATGCWWKGGQGGSWPQTYITFRKNGQSERAGSYWGSWTSGQQSLETDNATTYKGLFAASDVMRLCYFVEKYEECYAAKANPSDELFNEEDYLWRPLIEE